MTRKYEVVETFATIKRDHYSSEYNYSIQDMDVEKLVYNYDFEPHVGKRVKVIVMIGDKEEELAPCFACQKTVKESDGDYRPSTPGLSIFFCNKCVIPGGKNGSKSKKKTKRT